VIKSLYQGIQVYIKFAESLNMCIFKYPMNLNYILIAEDDEDDQFLLVSAFKELPGNIELIFVENGIELINHFKKIDQGIIKNLPSLLIVDLNMPKKNGKEAIKELKLKDYFRQFPTIVFSTTGNELEKVRCSELGIDDFFVKPSNYNGLVNLVSQFTKMANLSVAREI
jgi:DNA-binding response OmpR family regulator